MLDPASIALGLFGGVGGSYVVERYRHRQDLRRRGAAVLGPIFTLLVDADPDRLGMNAGDHSQGHLQELERRRAECNTTLETLAIELPPAAAKRAKALAVELHNAIHQASWLVSDLLNRSGSGVANIEQTRDRARAHHTTAYNLAVALGDDLRGSRSWFRRRRT